MFYRGTRFTHTQAYQVEGALVVDIRDTVEFDLTNAVYYTFVEGDTICGVAYKQYEDSDLWWAIMDANPRFQHEIEIKPGDLLLIPPREEVLKWL